MLKLNAMLNPLIWFESEFFEYGRIHRHTLICSNNNYSSVLTDVLRCDVRWRHEAVNVSHCNR